MDNSATITLMLKQTSEDSTDTSDLFTKGEFREHNGSYFIDYDESEATGYDGCHVQLRSAPDTLVMTRTGKTFSNLIFENGKRHFCHYDTGYGECVIGITTIDLQQQLNENGGELYVKYTLDLNAGLILTNEINIKIKKQLEE